VDLLLNQRQEGRPGTACFLLARHLSLPRVPGEGAHRRKFECMDGALDSHSERLPVSRRASQSLNGRTRNAVTPTVMFCFVLIPVWLSVVCLLSNGLEQLTIQTHTLSHSLVVPLFFVRADL